MKDASTQTEPATIIENEETINRTGINVGGLPLKRKRTIIEEEELIKKSKIMPGIEHVEEEIKMEEEKKIKSDASFYDKCKAYLDSFDHDKQNYYSIKHIIDKEVATNLLSLEQCTSSVFSTNIEESNTKEHKEDSLKAIVASMYLVYIDMKLSLDQQYYDNFQELLSVNMTDIFSAEISGDVISFLNKFY